MFKKFPSFKQLDQMDCGPTCLQIIAMHYGKKYALEELRARSFINREGVSLLGISEAAEAIGFHTLGIKIPFDKLKADAPLPCIIHVHQTHFIVVYKIAKNKIYVSDPAIGHVTYTESEFLKIWTSHKSEGVEVGVALLLEPTPLFFEIDADLLDRTKKGFSYLLSYFLTYKKFFVQLGVGLMAGSLIQLAFLFLTQSMVDVGIQTRNINFIYIVMGGQLVLTFSRTAVDFIRRWILLHISTRINISIISDFISKLVKLPMTFFEQKMAGDLLKRIDDHARIERFISSSSLNILFSFFNLVVFGLILLYFNVTIFTIFFIGSLIYVLYILMFLKEREKLDYKRFHQLSHNQSNLIDLMQSMQEIKLNNCETEKRWEWERIQAKLFRVTISSTKLQQYQEAGSTFINEIKNISITMLAATAVINGQMSLGTMLSIQYMIGQLNAPISDFINFIRDYQDAKISLERIAEIHEKENEDHQASQFASFHNIPANAKKDRSLKIQSMSFKYGGADSPYVLQDLSLAIPEGKVTAIVGASGSGKTTLLKILLKFYNPTSGKVLHGKSDLKDVMASHWRQRCGVVMQEGFIFNDTIAKNIALGGKEINLEKLQHAVRCANIEEFIDSLPLGFNTKIGREGLGISTGQKQRLLIARAVYKNPEYLFFDEATSALDSTNERIIMKNLIQFYKNRTVVVIAHRLSTVKNADQIIVLKNGKIIQQGIHTELVETRGAYFDLVKNQLELGN
jgi:ATP-binding cassette subfamily B protein